MLPAAQIRWGASDLHIFSRTDGFRTAPAAARPTFDQGATAQQQQQHTTPAPLSAQLKSAFPQLSCVHSSDVHLWKRVALSRGSWGCVPEPALVNKKINLAPQVAELERERCVRQRRRTRRVCMGTLEQCEQTIELSGKNPPSSSSPRAPRVATHIASGDVAVQINRVMT